MTLHLTIGRPTREGWDAVDDAGRVRWVPSTALGALRTLRSGQRVRAEVDAAGAVVRVTLP